MFIAFQIAAIVVGLLAIYLFSKSNLMIVKLVKLSAIGMVQLWTGVIDTKLLQVADKKALQALQSKLSWSILLHKRAKVLGYISLGLNFVAFLLRP